MKERQLEGALENNTLTTGTHGTTHNPLRSCAHNQAYSRAGAHCLQVTRRSFDFQPLYGYHPSLYVAIRKMLIIHRHHTMYKTARSIHSYLILVHFVPGAVIQPFLCLKATHLI